MIVDDLVQTGLDQIVIINKLTCIGGTLHECALALKAMVTKIILVWVVM